MRTARLAAAATAGMTLGVGTAAADTINVPDDYPTVQAAVDVAMDGDEVVVADGVYTGAGNRDIQTGTKSITIRSAKGPATCVIDCEASAPGFVIAGAARLEGFTIRNGSAVHGGALHVSGDATIENCFFTGNVAERGGAAYVTSSSPTFARCTFIDNDAPVWDGGAIYNISSSTTAINCVFAGNSAHSFGGAIFSDLASLDMVNCTLSDNVAAGGGGIANYAGVAMTLSNCILWGNEDVNGGGFNGQIRSTSSAEFVNYTCIEGLEDQLKGAGNTSADPLFADAAEYDFSLQPGSPCIDAADNGELPAGTLVDVAGLPRFVDDVGTPDTGVGRPPIADLGAHEFQGVTPGDCVADFVTSSTFQPPGDGQVDGADLAYLLGEWGAVSGGGSLADIVTSATFQPPPDGVVDGADLAYLLGAWGACE